jgi:hypothetical protein
MNIIRIICIEFNRDNDKLSPFFHMTGRAEADLGEG